ncbi:hypothetical protein Ga0074812_12574 [Parafrankia irregularis]|uniref:Uncharacterized protein n=1 Tax=Parafrankia irregularis TaxID=795642 RepID=A0A0S4QUA3_9ACTN|nr:MULTISPECIES: hypothetical protein [Frankiaceae]KPM50823.1 hypothetical protein ACG83_38030 [Frankia sp. R43]MBE3204843.1 hypothetical protein [Parafrankia sp. CH37]CUU59184.1 hypothetical protein Ga0074812_12574 [Parafrankia irregularis]
MTPEDLAGALTDVRRLRAGFAGTAPQPWTATTAAAEMTVQLGHLALCLLRRRGADTTGLHDPQRPITNTGDELADVLLAALSVPTLAGTEPAALPTAGPEGRDGEIEHFLRLLITVGQLAEAAMMHDGFRHQPTGTPPSIPAASASAVTAAGTLANRLRLDLLAEFRAMVLDADAFLRARNSTR